MTLALAAYRSSIHLDEPFVRSAPTAAIDARVAELVAMLRRERPQLTPGRADPRGQLRELLTTRPAWPLPVELDRALGEVLAAERRELIEARELEPVRSSNWTSAASLFLVRADITRLRVDAIVNAANDRLLGCFRPFHPCIDNAIHSAAGPRLREDCNTIMRAQGTLEPTGTAKITRAYELPSDFVLHTVGPIVPSGRVLPEHERELAAAYTSCLELAAEVERIRSIAFCAISTGVFGYPVGLAAALAVATVDRWLTKHPGAFDRIVFDVFSASDLEAYARVLGERP
ncbi:MAG: protein-ADP-ribose hydrolase [Deltaproteobacteria bacterium]|nr:protein-ADP-ribose hydrolase [Deltaproteobacteria bacterium]